jgi:hypothetical protein
MVDRIRNQQEKLDELRNEISRERHFDSDGDGITDIEERLKGTSPYSIDTDWDGRTDLEEVNAGTNSRTNNTDKQRSSPASDYLEAELEL